MPQIFRNRINLIKLKFEGGKKNKKKNKSSGAFPVPARDERPNDKNMRSCETLSNYPFTVPPLPPHSPVIPPPLMELTDAGTPEDRPGNGEGGERRENICERKRRVKK